MEAYVQAFAIDPDIFEQHSSQGVMVQERTIEERAGYYFLLAKTCAKAGMTDRTLQYIRKALENGFKEREKFKAEPEFSSSAGQHGVPADSRRGVQGPLKQRFRLALVLAASRSAACSRCSQSGGARRIPALRKSLGRPESRLDRRSRTSHRHRSTPGKRCRHRSHPGGRNTRCLRASATKLVHGYFEKRRESLHFEFVVEDAQTHKTLQTIAGDGVRLPVFDRLAKEIDAGAHPFSTANAEAVDRLGPRRLSKRRSA